MGNRLVTNRGVYLVLLVLRKLLTVHLGENLLETTKKINIVIVECYGISTKMRKQLNDSSAQEEGKLRRGVRLEQSLYRISLSALSWYPVKSNNIAVMAENEQDPKTSAYDARDIG